MRWRELWRELSRDQRRPAARAFWEADDLDDDVRDAALDYLIEHLHLRPQTMRRMPLAKRADHLARCGGPPPPVIQAALVQLHLRDRASMLGHFLDSLGVAHENGGIEEDPDGLDPPDREALVPAIRDLFARHPADEVSLYLKTLALGDGRFWARVPDALAEVEAQSGLPAPPPVTGERTLEDLKASEQEPVLQHGRGFDTLDRTLIKAVVASVAGAEGAFDEDQVRDLIEEVLHLNQDRHRSYFHLGFLDVMQGREASTDWPESNQDRRAWYLCGALSALVRRGLRDKARDLLRQHDDEVRLLGKGRHPGASLAVPLIFDLVWSGDEPASVVTMIGPPGLAQAGAGACAKVLDAATGLIRQLRGEEARPLLDLLFEAGGILAAAKRPLAERFMTDVRRRQAHSRRLSGDFDGAFAILEELIERGDTPYEGMITADLGLCACGLRALPEVQVPGNEDDWPAASRALEPGLEWFGRSVGVGDSHGAYCVGVYRLMRREHADAQDLLDGAVSSLQEQPDVYGPIRVLPRARLYLAYCLAERENPIHARRVRELAEDAVVHLGSEATGLARHILTYLAVVEPGQAVAMSERLFAELGDEAIDVIAEVQLLRKLPQVRAALLERAQAESTPRRDRFDAFERVLAASQRAGDRKTAEQALDGMEALADQDPERTRFLALLADPEKHGGFWDADDVAYARVRLFEDAGQLDEARVVLNGLGHRLLGRDDEIGAAEAEGVVERIRSYGMEPDERLVARVEAAHSRSEEIAEPAPTARGCILFIGGNEAQRNLAESIRGWVNGKWTEVSIEFEHPNFSSNWGRQLDALKGRMADADAVVLMPLVRTHYGRGVRKLCGVNDIPWIACTGPGRKMMQLAIERAVTVVGRRKGGTA